MPSPVARALLVELQLLHDELPEWCQDTEAGHKALETARRRVLGAMQLICRVLEEGGDVSDLGYAPPAWRDPIYIYIYITSVLSCLPPPPPPHTHT